MHITRRVFSVNIMSCGTHPLYTSRINITQVVSLHYLIHTHTAAKPKNFNHMYYSLAEWGVRTGSARVLKLLIECGFDIDFDFGLLIRRAVASDHKHIVDILIAAGVDVNLCGEHFSAIRMAIDHASVGIVSKLLDAGAVPPRNVIKRLLAIYTKDRPEKVALIENYFNKKDYACVTRQ